MVRDLYPRFGFTVVDDDGSTATFVHDLATVVAAPGHIALISELATDDPAPAGSPLPARD
jgi:hypothetical protein